MIRVSPLNVLDVSNSGACMGGVAAMIVTGIEGGDPP
jgi:hypothetical protein